MCILWKYEHRMKQSIVKLAIEVSELWKVCGVPNKVDWEFKLKFCLKLIKELGSGCTWNYSWLAYRYIEEGGGNAARKCSVIRWKE